MKHFRLLSLPLAALSLFACSKNNETATIDPNADAQIFSSAPVFSAGPASSAVAQVKEFEGDIREHELYRYPEVTITAKVANPQKTADLVRQAGGRVDYDPNFGSGSRIPFLIFTLPPQKLTDPAFVGSLQMSQAEISTPSNSGHIDSAARGSALVREMSVPVADIRLPQFRERVAGKGLGEGTIIAVIDTGIDASHPAVGDRVIYWNDHTQEFRTALAPATLVEGKIQLGTDKTVDMPAALDASAPVYTAVINEKAFAAQMPIADRAAGATGVDINKNSSKTDKFLVVVGTMSGTSNQVAFVDTNGDGRLSATEATQPVADFNDARGAVCRKGRTAPAGTADMLRFPSRARSVAYPLILEREDGTPKFVSLGVDLEMHGTHVAGIAAGNGAGIQGAAPNAKLMSLKVCSGISCTSAAMSRGILDAFYNPSGCVPDVVNISIGGPQDYKEHNIDLLIRDLSAKFGTTFFVSAGNSGPGYRTQNHIAAFGPAVMVGAHVSAAMREQLYLGNPTQNIVPDTLFYFSSAGPSYTGALRPNIVAPGAAFSSVPLVAGGSDMYNGTSMAAPISTGGAAALLSLAKVQPEATALLARRDAKITSLLAGTDTVAANGSMLSYAMALRTALEGSARALPNLTSPQQGYGLIDIPAAYDLFLQKLQGLNDNRFAYGELDINGNSEANRLYNRDGNNMRVKPITLTLREDGEADDAYHLRMRNTSLEVVLDQVEVQSSDGTVVSTAVTDDNIAGLPFSLLVPGQIEQGANRRAAILVGNSLANIVTSYRKLEMMVPGKTYSARYHVLMNGERIQSIVDLVHAPLLFSDQAMPVDVPAIDPNTITRPAVIGVRNQEISYNALHRYPVLLTDRDSGMHVSVGIPANVTGTLMLTVYDPDGQKCADSAASRSPVAGLAHADAMIALECAKTKSGIYEVTVSAGSGRWAANSRYDLLMEASRVRVGAEKITLATKASHAGEDVARETTLSIAFDPRQVGASNSDDKDQGQLSIKASDPMYMDRVAVPVQSQRWTFKRLNLPPASVLGDKETVDVTVSLSSANKEDVFENYSGQIDNKVYKLSADGTKYEAVAGVSVESENKEAKISGLDAKGTDQLYIAIETYNYIVTPKGQGPNILWDFVWDLPVPGVKKLQIETSYQAGSGVALVKIKAPDDISGLAAADEAVAHIQSVLIIEGGSLQQNTVFVTILH